MGALGGGGKGGGGVTGGLDPFQSALFGQATGQNQQAMVNRYQQLGLGGQSPSTWSTPEQMDVQGLAGLGTAASAQLEPGNIQNQLAQSAQQNAALTNLGGALGSAGSSFSSLGGFGLG